jgi:hypothetical protein
MAGKPWSEERRQEFGTKTKPEEYSPKVEESKPSDDDLIIAAFKKHIEATLNGSQPDVTLTWVQGLKGYLDSLEILKKG